jgi:anthranilate phosphoribosyltransferase
VDDDGDARPPLAGGEEELAVLVAVAAVGLRRACDRGSSAVDPRGRRAYPARPGRPRTGVIQQALTRLLDGRDLARDEARSVMGEIMAGEATPAQIAGFLVALRAKGETVAEIAGCAEAMRDHVVAVRPRRDDLVDTAGTGGDGARTLNISTAAALVAAAAGAGVAKHGNRAVSSACGSADVLEALGFRLELPPERIAESIDRLGFGFMFAPTHHPAMRHAAPVRRELATRTIFNVLGPLTNPAGARAQLMGVYSAALVPTIAAVLAELGARRAFVVHGFAGIDELSPSGPNLVCEVVDGSVLERTVDPGALGLEPCPPEELTGGSAAENAESIRAVLNGRNGGRRSAILLNAAGAIAAAGHAEDLRDGLEQAREAVDSGAAGGRLEELVRFSVEGGDGAV